MLPTYASIGVAAPVLLCLLRFAQGIGLGGEWGGAALIATENAPAHRKTWFGMFPQLGAVLGFLMANGIFLLMVTWLGETEFRAWGWRVPFVLSLVLLAVGMYVRMSLHESEAFTRVQQRKAIHALPMTVLLSKHAGAVARGALAMMVSYALFNIATVFMMGHATNALGMSRETVLLIQCGTVGFMGLGIVLASQLSDRLGRNRVLLVACLLGAPAGLLLTPALNSGTPWAIASWLAVALFATGLSFGPMGAHLPQAFPADVRYSGASLAYNLGGILGASAVPWLAQHLVSSGGPSLLSAYVMVAALVSAAALWRERPNHPD